MRQSRYSSCFQSAKHIGSTRNRSVVNIKDFERGNDENIIDFLEAELNSTSEDNVCSLWVKIKDAIKFSIEYFVPSRKVGKNRNNSWVNREIIKIKRKIKRRRRQYNTSKSQPYELKQELLVKVYLAGTIYFNVTLPKFIK